MSESVSVWTFEVGAERVGTRLDVFVNECAQLSRSQCKRLCELSMITVNGETKKAGYSLKSGDCVSVTCPPDRELDLQGQDIPISIVYEDDDLAIVDKPQGMVVHPAPGAYEGTLVHALLYRLQSLSSINGVIRPGIVHRLDKDTSGLLAIAKNDAAHVDLQRQIAEKTACRVYIALCDGQFAHAQGVIDTYLDRSAKDRKKMAVMREARGRRAVTHYRVLKSYRNYTLVQFVLETGRTHQIRVHAKHIGHPVVGDATYGGSNAFDLAGQLLHATQLELTHPTVGRRMRFSTPIPEYFAQVLRRIASQSADDVEVRDVLVAQRGIEILDDLSK